MRCKVSFAIIGILVVVFGCGMLGGCGGVPFDEVTYSYPNWTPEGLIYCIKSVTHYRKYSGIGGQYSETLGTDYSYVTMDTNGNNETTLPYNSYPYFSPKGTYVALINGSTISIIRRSDNQQVYEFTPTTESISELDWGPNEDKLLYITSGKNLFTISSDGVNNKYLVNNCLNAIWFNPNQIVLEYFSSTEGIYLSTISSEGDSLIKLKIGYSPQIYSTSEVLYNYSEDIRLIKTDGTNDILLFSSYKKSKPKLSPNKLLIVGGAGYDTVGNSGIFVININGANSKQLR